MHAPAFVVDAPKFLRSCVQSPRAQHLRMHNAAASGDTGETVIMRNLLVCAAVFAAGAVTPAAAADVASLPRDAVVVTYDDLNLANPADRATLNERVDKAVAQVCRARFVAPMEDLAACRAALHEHVVSQTSGAVRSALANENMATASTTHSRQ
jgi:UrcA family protein